MVNFLAGLFNRRDKKAEQTDRIEVMTASAPALAPVDQVMVEVKEEYYPTQIQFGVGQSVGIQRDHNEDAVFALSSTVADSKGQLPFGLFIVTDGMGGHRFGEVASSSAARSLADHVLMRLYRHSISYEVEAPMDSVQEVMGQAVEEAHRIVSNLAPGGGTTCTALLLLGDQITLAHVGDSRAYFIEHGSAMKLLTQDHSLVQRLVELGQLTEEQAKHYPQKNILYKALGQPEALRADISTHVFTEAGYLMICSDGLWGCVSEVEIIEIINSEKDLTKMCHRMVQAANYHGGPDNITVILVKYR